MTGNSLFLLPAMLLTALSCAATAVECRPGELSSLVEAPGGIAELKLTGSANASDFFFIASEMPSLRTLDISECSIEAYSGAAINGLTSYPAATVPQGAFAGTAISEIIFPTNASISIGDCAFAGTPVETLTLTGGIASIGQGAFAGCHSLRSVVLGSSAMGGYVFSNCSALTDVEFRSPIALGDGEFEGCSALARLGQTTAVTAIGNKAFAGCGSLTEFTFANVLAKLGDAAFASTSLEVARLDHCTKLESVGAWAFAGNSSLTTVTLPISCITIGEGMCFGCTSLSAMTFPAYLSEIPPYMLAGDTSLKGLSVPAHSTAIGEYAFAGTSGVKEMSLPEPLEYIGDNAMEGMTSLTVIAAQALKDVPELGRTVWQGVRQSDVRLEVYPDMAASFEAAGQWREFHIVPSEAHDGLEDITTPEAALHAFFDGTLLKVSATGTDIASLELFDLAGRTLVSMPVGAASAQTDTAPFSNDIFLIRCILGTGNAAILKLAR